MKISEKSRKKLLDLIYLNRRELGDFRLLLKLKLVTLPPQDLFSGKTYFSIYFKDTTGRLSQRPVIDRALYSVGGKAVPPWIEIGFYRPIIAFEREVTSSGNIDITGTELEEMLFHGLGDLIPPGGHMMFPYDLDDDALSRMTGEALRRSIPMVVTPIGHLLFRVGFVIPFRDWYIAEGGHEGPRKLQFEKPVTAQRGRKALEAVLEEITTFIDRSSEITHDEVLKACVEHASQLHEKIIEKIGAQLFPSSGMGRHM